MSIPFIHLSTFIQQLFTEHLIHARAYFGQHGGGSVGRMDQAVSCHIGAHTLVGKVE